MDEVGHLAEREPKEEIGQPNEQRKGAPKEVHEDKRDDPEALENQTQMILDSILYHKNVWYSKWNLKAL